MKKTQRKEKKQFLIPKLLLQMWKEKFFFRKRFLIFFSGSFILKMLLKVIKEIRSSFFIKLVFIMTFRAAF